MSRRVFIADLFILVVLTILARSFSYFPFDLSATRLLQTINIPWFDSLMKFLSFIGEPERFIPLALVVIFLIWIHKKREGLFILSSFVGIGVIGEVLKILVNRSRPSPLLVHQFLPELGNDSYPSGHVLLYLGLLGPLLYIVGRQMKSRFPKLLIQIFLWLLILLIGVSRVYLGEHWLSDVAGSYLTGIAWLYIIIRFYTF